DDVGHDQERGHPGAELGGEVGLAFLELEVARDRVQGVIPPSPSRRARRPPTFAGPHALLDACSPGQASLGLPYSSSLAPSPAPRPLNSIWTYPLVSNESCWLRRPLSSDEPLGANSMTTCSSPSTRV